MAEKYDKKGKLTQTGQGLYLNLYLDFYSSPYDEEEYYIDHYSFEEKPTEQPLEDLLDTENVTEETEEETKVADYSSEFDPNEKPEKSKPTHVKWTITIDQYYSNREYLIKSLMLGFGLTQNDAETFVKNGWNWSDSNYKLTELHPNGAVQILNPVDVGTERVTKVPYRSYVRVMGQFLKEEKTEYYQLYREMLNLVDVRGAEYEEAFPLFNQRAAKFLQEIHEGEMELHDNLFGPYTPVDEMYSEMKIMDRELVNIELRNKDWGYFKDLQEEYPNVMFTYQGFVPEAEGIIDRIVLQFEDEQRAPRRVLDALGEQVLKDYRDSHLRALKEIVHRNLIHESTPKAEMVFFELEAVSLIIAGEAEGIFDEELVKAYGEANLAAMRLRGYGADDNTSEPSEDIEAVSTFLELVWSLMDQDKHKIPQGMAGIGVPANPEHSAMWPNKYYDLGSYFYFQDELVSAKSPEDYEKVVNLYLELKKAFVTYMSDRLAESEHPEVKTMGTKLRAVAGLSANIEALLSEHPDAVRVQAFYFPDAVYKNEDQHVYEQIAQDGAELFMYLYKQDGDWVLKDFTNPEDVKTNEESGSLTDLFNELDSSLRFPAGVVHWVVPASPFTAGEVERGHTVVTGDMSLSGWLTYIGIGIAIVGITLATAGAGTPATVAFVTGGLLTAGGALADMVEHSEQGMLTTEIILLDTAMIVSSLASAGTASGGRLIVHATAAFDAGMPLVGNMAKLAVFADRIYKPLAGVSLGANMVALGTFTKVAFDQYQALDQITDPKLRAEMQSRLISNLLLSGGLMVLGIRGDLKQLSGGHRLRLFQDADGVVTANLIPNDLNVGGSVVRGTQAQFDAEKARFKAYREAQKPPEGVSNRRVRDWVWTQKRKNLGSVKGRVGNHEYEGNIESSGNQESVHTPIFRSFKTNSNDELYSPDSWLRKTDTEYKMLTQIAKDQGAVMGKVYRNVKGEITIVSENPYCVSCQGVIQDFSRMFPNVKVTLIDGVRW